MIGTELMAKERRKHHKDGIIINVASLVGLDPYHLLPIYTASKHAIVGFSRAYSVSEIMIKIIVVEFFFFHANILYSKM